MRYWDKCFIVRVQFSYTEKPLYSGISWDETICSILWGFWILRIFVYSIRSTLASISNNPKTNKTINSTFLKKICKNAAILVWFSITIYYKDILYGKMCIRLFEGFLLLRVSVIERLFHGLFCMPSVYVCAFFLISISF